MTIHLHASSSWTTQPCFHQVCFEVVGYLLEELRDNNNLEAFRKDVESANIFIGSLIFIEELAEKVGMHAGERFPVLAANA